MAAVQDFVLDLPGRARKPQHVRPRPYIRAVKPPTLCLAVGVIAFPVQ